MGRPRRTPARLVLVLALALTALPLAAGPATATARSTAELRLEQRLTDLHADARRSPGEWAPGTGTRVARIAPWSDLRGLARAWSDHQAAGRCSGGAVICHRTGLGDVVQAWRSLGENVAWRSVTNGQAQLTDAALNDLARQVMASWMASSGHRANILRPDWDDFGTSATYRRTALGDGRYRHEVFATAIFRRRDGTPPGYEYGGPLITPRSIDRACAGSPAHRFPDLVAGSLLARAAGCLAAWDVTHGRTDGTYGARARVTRGQMAAFLDRALAGVGAAPPTPSATRFPDTGSSVHRDAIERLAAAGIVAGRADGTFAPGDQVTRAQMATFLRRAYEHAAGRTMTVPASPFRDTATSTHRDAISAIAHVRLAAGTEPGRYRPGDAVTRGQMASFLARWLDLAVTDGLATGPR